MDGRLANTVSVTLSPPAVNRGDSEHHGALKQQNMQHKAHRTYEAASFLWRGSQKVIEAVRKEQVRHRRLYLK